MNVIRKIKSLLPISSRSAHAGFEEIVGLIHQQREERAVFEDKAMFMLWELYRREGETLEDAHRRLFEQMPQATGGLRLYQLASAQLLHEFDALCQREGIRYWMVSGTLLGSVRHKGFIPWDDDLDVGMTRQDLERLIEVVSSYDRYRVTQRYDRLALCRQTRFSFADERVPCFMDLFAFDPVVHADDSSFEAREQARETLKRSLLTNAELGFWNEQDFYVDAADPRAAKIAAYFDDALKGIYDDGICTSDAQKSEGIIWSITNNDSYVKHHSWYLIPIDSIFPLCRLQFEGFEANAPADYRRCLSTIYGDIYELPDDLGAHFQHIGDEELADCGVESALKSVIGAN